MNRSFSEGTALLLAAMLLALSLLACGGNTNAPDANNGDNASTGNNSGTNGSGSTSDDAYLDFVYTASYQTLTTDEELSSIDRVTYANGKLYMVAWMVTGTQVDYYDENWNLITDEEKIANGEYAQTSEYDKTEPVICSMNIDGTDFQILENFSADAGSKDPRETAI